MNNMAKEISMGMWVSVIPDKMYDSWVKRGFIKKTATDFEDYSGKKHGFVSVMEKDGVRRVLDCTLETKILKDLGWKRIYRRYRVKSDIYDIMRKEVGEWYDKVFLYVTAWFKEHGYIKLKKGGFSGGFCAVHKEDETTKGWGAPLAETGNKVVQIKEKFGHIVVYLDSLSEANKKEIDKFAKHVEKKFDCRTRFN
jgi:hypothetical protein